MYYFRNNIISAFILAAILFLECSSALAQQVKTPQEVKVVNTNSNPIPTTIINNAENPVLTRTTGTTDVSGSVTIANSSSAPIPVIVNNDPAKQAFRLAAVCDDGICENLSSSIVPAGKRLVIKYLSTVLYGFDGGVPYVNLLVIPHNKYKEQFSLDVKRSLINSNSFRSGEEVLIYVEAGESLQFQMGASAQFSSATMKAYASGYYVDLP